MLITTDTIKIINKIFFLSLFLLRNNPIIKREINNAIMAVRDIENNKAINIVIAAVTRKPMFFLRNSEALKSNDKTKTKQVVRKMPSSLSLAKTDVARYNPNLELREYEYLPTKSIYVPGSIIFSSES